MFGAYPFGEPYFGQAPNRTAIIVLFGKICDTALMSLNAAQRLTGLDGPRTMQALAPIRRVLNRNSTLGLAGGTRRTMPCAHD